MSQNEQPERLDTIELTAPAPEQNENFDAAEAFSARSKESDGVEENDGAAEENAEGVGDELQTAEDDGLEFSLKEGPRKFSRTELEKIVSSHTETLEKAAEAERLSETRSQQLEQLETLSNLLLERAQAQYAEYAQIDWRALASDPNVDKDLLVQLQQDATKAYQNVAYLQQEAQQRLEQQRQETQSRRVAEAQAAVKELTDPINGIKDFQTLYPKLVDYGRGAGIPDVENVTVPNLIRILHKAYLYDQGRQSASDEVKRVVNKQTKTLRPGANRVEEGVETHVRALKELRAQPDNTDAIASAFLSRF